MNPEVSVETRCSRYQRYHCRTFLVGPPRFVYDSVRNGQLIMLIREDRAGVYPGSRLCQIRIDVGRDTIFSAGTANKQGEYCEQCSNNGKHHRLHGQHLF